MTALARRLTADQETSHPEHDELLSMACAQSHAIAAAAFERDEASPSSRRSLTNQRDAALRAFHEKLTVALESLTRTLQCNVGHEPSVEVQPTLNTLARAQRKVQNLLDGSIPLPPLAVAQPVAHLATEVMRPLHEASTPRSQTRKKIVGYVDISFRLRRVASLTLEFPTYVSPLRGRPAPDLFLAQSPSLSRAEQTAQAIIDAAPKWAVAYDDDSHVWVSVRSQPILVGEILQELKMLRERMRDEGLHGHVAVVGPMTGSTRSVIEAEGFLPFDKTDLSSSSNLQLAQLSLLLPCELSPFASMRVADLRQPIAA